MPLKQTKMVENQYLLDSAIEDVKYVHQKSFHIFCANWSRYRDQYEHPLRNKQSFTKKHSVKTIIDAGLGRPFVHRLETFIEGFIKDTVVPRLENEEYPQEFLNLFVEFCFYMKSVYQWLMETFDDFNTLVPGHDKRSFANHCRMVAYKTFYEHIKVRLREETLKVLHNIRMYYPYSSFWMYEAFHNDFIGILTSFIEECTEVEDINTFWWSPTLEYLLNDLYESFEDLDESCQEGDFLIFARQCIEVETNVFKILKHPARDSLEKVGQALRNMVCEEYLKRSETYMMFMCVDYLDEEEDGFDKYTLEDVIDIHMLSSNHKDRFLQSLKSNVRNKHLDMVLEMEREIDCTMEWTVPQFKPLLDRFWKYEQVITSRLNEYLERFPELKDVIRECSKNLFESLAEREIFEKIVVTQEKVINSLCEPDDLEGLFDRDVETVGRFFKFVANQKTMMKELEAFVKREIESGRDQSITHVAKFVALEDVKKFVPPSLSETLMCS